MLPPIGQRIREARQRYGMSQAELARRIGLSKTSLHLIETGRTADPHLSYVVAIADQLRLSVDALLGREGPRQEAVHA